MTKLALKINDVAVSRGPIEYVCYGLGSCVGVFVIDRAEKIYGGAHVPMADDNCPGSFSGAVHLLDKLLKGFVEHGSDLKNLRAKVTGGAKVFTGMDPGLANSAAVKSYLIRNRIFIAAVDVGGTIARTASFCSLTEIVQISTSERMSYSI